MEYYYGTTVTPLAKGKAFRNPLWFLKPELNADHVYVVGDWPRVVDAYKKAGVGVTVLNESAARAVMPAETIPATAYLPTAERRSEQDRVDIPADWQQMRWADLRRLAASVSDTPIINKKQAVAAIHAALKRRGGRDG